MKKLIATLLAGVMMLSFAACGSKIEWPNTKIANVVPQPESTNGEVTYSSSSSLSFHIEKASISDYQSYIDSCKEAGFVVESKEKEMDYEAYNQDGYQINVYYYDHIEQISVYAYPPRELGELEWPTIGLATMIPKLESNLGKISADRTDYFSVIVGKTSKDEFKKYVDSCEKKGFNLDYSKQDEYYSAVNKDGYKIMIKYEGFSIVDISISAPKKEETSSIIENPPKVEESEEQEYDWQSFIDDYEAWVDDYIDFVTKYKANPTDMSLLSDYAKMLSDMTEWSERADEIQDNLSAAEAAKYSAELAKIATKLAQAAY